MKNLTNYQTLEINPQIKELIQIFAPYMDFKRLSEFGKLKTEVNNQAEIIEETRKLKQPEEYKKLLATRDKKVQEYIQENKKGEKEKGITYQEIDVFLLNNWKDYLQFIAKSEEVQKNESAYLKEINETEYNFSLSESKDFPKFTAKTEDKKSQFSVKIAPYIETINLLLE